MKNFLRCLGGVSFIFVVTFGLGSIFAYLCSGYKFNILAFFGFSLTFLLIALTSILASNRHTLEAVEKDRNYVRADFFKLKDELLKLQTLICILKDNGLQEYLNQVTYKFTQDQAKAEDQYRDFLRRVANLQDGLVLDEFKNGQYRVEQILDQAKSKREKLAELIFVTGLETKRD